MKEDSSKFQGSEAHAELVLKVLLVGAPKSGKTSFVRRLCDKPFRADYVPTLGFDITVVPYGTYQIGASHRVTDRSATPFTAATPPGTPATASSQPTDALLEGRPVSLQLWDVAGSQLKACPCHHALMASGTDGVLYVLDVTSRDSLQAIDQWDHALSKYLPPWSSKLLVGHKADLPVYVVNDEALSLYIASADGFRGWCLTVGNSDYGDYDVAARRGGGGAWGSDGGGRYQGQSLSGEKQLSVSEAVRTLIGHVFRTGKQGSTATRMAGVVGLGASATAASPLPPAKLDEALDVMRMLGLGCQGPPRDVEDGSDSTMVGIGREPSEKVNGSMRELLRHGRGPEPGWKERRRPMVRPHGGQNTARGDVDAGWNYFAGRMGREEAETLLRGRPEGTFFLRRKGPNMLVLTYVAKDDQGGVRKSVGGTPSQPPSTSDARGVASEGPGRRVTLAGEVPLGDISSTGRGGVENLGKTSVQHALLVYEGDYFSDEKARLGRFATLQELLNSKISAIARDPLTFKRERDRYVLVEKSSEGDASIMVRAPDNASSSATATPDVVFGGTNAAVREPNLIRGLFAGRGQQRTPSVVSLALDTDRPSSATSPVVSVAERLSRSSPVTARAGKSDTPPGDWGGKQPRKHAARTSTSASGESLWMEAAEAVQKSAGALSGGAKTRRRASRATVAGSARPRTGSLGEVFPSAPRSRSRSRKGSMSSMEDSSMFSIATEAMELDRAPLSLEGLLRQQQQQQQQQQKQKQKQQQQQQEQEQEQKHQKSYWRGFGESMAAAAAAAAQSASTAATITSHPQAKILLERIMYAQSTIETVADAFEVHMRPIARQVHSGGRVASSLASRELSSGSPLPSPSTEGQGWFASPDSEQAPRFDLVASLLVKRALSSRDALLGSMNSIRERAVALAVVEGAPIGGRGADVAVWDSVAAAREFGSLSSSPIHLAPPTRPLQAPTQARSAGDRAGDLPAISVLSKDAGRASPIGGIPMPSEELGLTTCQDFDRILSGVERGSELANESKSNVSSASGAVRLESYPGLFDAGGSNANSSSPDVSVRRSMHDAAGAGASYGWGDGSPGPKFSSDTWSDIISAVRLVEEQCRTFVGEWESAATVMADVCVEGVDSSEGALAQ